MHQRLFRQNSGKSKSSTPAPNRFQSRPFAPAQEESPQLQETPDLEQLKQNALQSKGSGFNFANVNVTPRQANPLGVLQRKLTMGQAGDKYEQEADRVAADVVQRIHSPETEMGGEGAVQKAPLPSGRVRQQQTSRTISSNNGEGLIQRYIEISKLFPLLDRLGLDNNKRHRVMHWNAVGVFDDVMNNDEKLRAKILEFSEISQNVGEGVLAPGQLHKDEKLPGWFDYFSEFETELPNNWGMLRFKKGFDRVTAHGWISDNVVLPKEEFPKGVAVHVILAVSEYTSEQVVINPHVTVRLKSAQDMFDQIALINDQKTKAKETQTLGKEGAQSSLSMGMRSDRGKENTNASERIGKSLEELKENFTHGWLEGIVKDAWEAAQAHKETVKPSKSFVIK